MNIKKITDKLTTSEWSLVNIAKRIIAYAVSFGFIGIAILFFEKMTIGALLFILLGLYYPIIDIATIIHKARNRN